MSKKYLCKKKTVLYSKVTVQKLTGYCMTGMADERSLPELEAYFALNNIPLPPPLEPAEIVRIVDAYAHPPFDYRAEYARRDAFREHDILRRAYAPIRVREHRVAKECARIKIRELAVEERPDLYPCDHNLFKNLF